MLKYHINPETGNPGPCSAEVKCPFGDLAADHYPTKEAARAAFEERMIDETVEVMAGFVKSMAREEFNNDPNGSYQTPDISGLTEKRMKETLAESLRKNPPKKEMKERIQKLNEMREDLKEKGFPLPAGDPLLGDSVKFHGLADNDESRAHVTDIHDLVAYEQKNNAAWTEDTYYHSLKDANGEILIDIDKATGATHTDGLFSKYPHRSLKAKRAKENLLGFLNDNENMSSDAKAELRHMSVKPRVYWRQKDLTFELVEPADGSTQAIVHHSGADRGKVELSKE